MKDTNSRRLVSQDSVDPVATPSMVKREGLGFECEIELDENIKFIIILRSLKCKRKKILLG